MRHLACPRARLGARARGRSRGHARARGQQGLVLPLVLAATLVGGLVVAALVALVFSNVTSTHAYRGRTDNVGRANDAISLAVAVIRTDPTMGLAGGTFSATYDGFDVTCVGATGSGEVGTDSTADRRVTCTASVEGVTPIQPKVRATVRFVDNGGNGPGAEIEIVDRDILG